MNANLIKTFVWMPGQWNKKKAMENFKNSLQESGSKVLAFSLPCIENAADQGDKMQMLDNHINFVTNQIISLNLSNVILCGHSYSGLVITAVGDRIAERINALIYLDGYIPDNSDASWLIVNDINKDLFGANLSRKLKVQSEGEADSNSLGKRYSVYTKSDCPQRHHVAKMFKLFSKKTPIYSGSKLEPYFPGQEEDMNKGVDSSPESIYPDIKKVKHPSSKITAILLEVPDFKCPSCNF